LQLPDTFSSIHDCYCTQHPQPLLSCLLLTTTLLLTIHTLHHRCLCPRLQTGAEPTFCMGDDVPLPVLASTPHMLYDYFKQRFAQVGALRARWLAVWCMGGST
jgi:hypothetical protein